MHQRPRFGKKKGNDQGDYNRDSRSDHYTSNWRRDSQSECTLDQNSLDWRCDSRSEYTDQRSECTEQSYDQRSECTEQRTECTEQSYDQRSECTEQSYDQRSECTEKTPTECKPSICCQPQPRGTKIEIIRIDYSGGSAQILPTIVNSAGSYFLQRSNSSLFRSDGTNWVLVSTNPTYYFRDVPNQNIWFVATQRETISITQKECLIPGDLVYDCCSLVFYELIKCRWVDVCKKDRVHGPTGPCGPCGPTGSCGPAGPQGLVGAEGPQGPSFGLLEFSLKNSELYSETPDVSKIFDAVSVPSDGIIEGAFLITGLGETGLPRISIFSTILPTGDPFSPGTEDSSPFIETAIWNQAQHILPGTRNVPKIYYFPVPDHPEVKAGNMITLKLAPNQNYETDQIKGYLRFQIRIRYL